MMKSNIVKTKEKKMIPNSIATSARDHMDSAKTLTSICGRSTKMNGISSLRQGRLKTTVDHTNAMLATKASKHRSNCGTIDKENIPKKILLMRERSRKEISFAINVICHTYAWAL